MSNKVGKHFVFCINSLSEALFRWKGPTVNYRNSFALQIYIYTFCLGRNRGVVGGNRKNCSKGNFLNPFLENKNRNVFILD